MALGHQTILSRRVVGAILTLAIAVPATANGAGYTVIHTAGLYDLGTTPGSTPSHIAGYSSGTGTYTLTNNSVSTGTLNNNGISSIPFVNSSGAIAGSAYRYAVDTQATGSNGADTWYYDPTTTNSWQTNLSGALYTGTNSNTNGANKFFNDAGYVSGTSQEYAGTGLAGFGAWVYVAPTAAHPQGVTSHIQFNTGPSGGQNSYSNTVLTANGGGNKGESFSLSGMNTSGLTIGSASMYSASDGTTARGIAAFIADTNGVATRIGLTDPSYTLTNALTSNNTQSSSVTAINNNGVVVGSSTNYTETANGLSSFGLGDSYLYDPVVGTSKVIGLQGTAANANYSPLFQGSNSSGLTITGAYGSINTTNSGLSTSYAATGFNGAISWYYNIANQTTSQISLVGQTVPNSSGNTYANGSTTPSYQGLDASYQRSSISGINASDQMAGTQTIYLPGGTLSNGTPSGRSSAGQDAFIVTGGGTPTIIGLTDSSHTATAGATVRNNSVSVLNNAGQVAGTATIYNGISGATANTNQGSDAWFYSSATAAPSVPIGLPYSTAATQGTTTGATSATNTALSPASNIYTSITQSTSVKTMNVNGQVVGQSARYLDKSISNTAGTDAYFYTPGGTSVQIGLVGGVYLSNNTLTESSTVLFLNNNTTDALAAGNSVKYTGGTANSTAAGSQDAWVYDSATNTTYGITSLLSPVPQYLSDNGVLVGSYTNGSTTEAFAYTIAGGVVDLGNASALLAANSWQQLAFAYAADPAGEIIGRGVLSNDTAAYSSSQNSAVFVVTTPEPASLGLMGAGMLALLSRRRGAKR